jgi:hypothetical protein
MTPNATAITAATTTSMVRHRGVVFCEANQEKTHAAPGGHRTAARLEVDRTPCAGITQIRFEGLRAVPALSALCAPLSDVKLSRRR